MKRYALLDEMEDGCYTQKALCELSGYSRQAVQRALGELVKEGLVSIARQRRPVVYTRSDKPLTDAQKVRKAPAVCSIDDVLSQYDHRPKALLSLQQALGCSRGMAHRYTQQLVQQGKVRCAVAGHGTPSLYVLMPTPKATEARVKIKVPRSPTVGGNGLLTKHLFQHTYTGRVTII